MIVSLPEQWTLAVWSSEAVLTKHKPGVAFLHLCWPLPSSFPRAPVLFPAQVRFTCRPKTSAKFNACLRGSCQFYVFFTFWMSLPFLAFFSTGPLPCMPPAGKTAQIFLTIASGSRIMRSLKQSRHMQGPDLLQFQLLKEKLYMALTTSVCLWRFFNSHLS